VRRPPDPRTHDSRDLEAEALGLSGRSASLSTGRAPFIDEPSSASTSGRCTAPRREKDPDARGRRVWVSEADGCGRRLSTHHLLYHPPGSPTVPPFTPPLIVGGPAWFPPGHGDGVPRLPGCATPPFCAQGRSGPSASFLPPSARGWPSPPTPPPWPRSLRPSRHPLRLRLPPPPQRLQPRPPRPPPSLSPPPPALPPLPPRVPSRPPVPPASSPRSRCALPRLLGGPLPSSSRRPRDRAPRPPPSRRQRRGRNPSPGWPPPRPRTRPRPLRRRPPRPRVPWRRLMAPPSPHPPLRRRGKPAPPLPGQGRCTSASRRASLLSLCLLGPPTMPLPSPLTALAPHPPRRRPAGEGGRAAGGPRRGLHRLTWRLGRWSGARTLPGGGGLVRGGAACHLGRRRC